MAINFTNPVPRIGYAAEQLGIKTVGLCHQIHHAYNNLNKSCNKEQLCKKNRWYADSDGRKQNLTNIWKQVESSFVTHFVHESHFT